MRTMVESKPPTAQQFVNRIERFAARKAVEVSGDSAGVSTQTDGALDRYGRTWSVGVLRPRHTLCRFPWMPGARLVLGPREARARGPGKTIRLRLMSTSRVLKKGGKICAL